MSTTNASSIVQPYLFLDGRCEEAIEFYQSAVGAKLKMLMRWKDSPEPPKPGCVPDGAENKVMHAQIQIGETVIMMSDGRCTGKPVFSGFALSLSVGTEAEVDKLMAGLADGGVVQMPVEQTFFSARFGMVTDRFGVWWMILVRPVETK